jgi:hypothetical protein
MNSWKNKISIILAILLPVFALAYFAMLDIRPSGELRVSLRPGESSYYINAPLPEVRREVSADGWHVLAEPLYIPIRKPQGDFTSMTLRLHFEPGDASLLAIGPRMSIFTGAANLKPLYSAALEAIPHTETILENQSLYSQSETLLTSLFRSQSKRNNIVTYFASENVPYRGSAPMYRESVSYEVDLRGSHSFYAYVQGGSLEFAVDLTDMNRSVGVDDALLRIVNEQEEAVFEQKSVEDKNDRQDQRVTESTLRASLSGLDEGVYRIEFISTSDQFIRRISTNASKFVMTGTVFTGDGIGYRADEAAPVYYGRTDYLRLETPHAEGAQTVRFGSESVSVEEPLTIYQLKGSAEPQRLSLEKRDMRVSGVGYFSLNPTLYFEPYPPQLTAQITEDDLDGKHILTTYNRVDAEIDGTMFAEAHFTLEGVPVENDYYRFVLSAPYLNGESPLIKSIEVIYEKPAITSFADFIHELKVRLPFY